MNCEMKNNCVISNQDSELFLLGGDSHKKKKKHTDDYYYRGERFICCHNLLIYQTMTLQLLLPFFLFLNCPCVRPRWFGSTSPQEKAQVCRPLPSSLVPLILPPDRHRDGPPAGYHLSTGHRYGPQSSFAQETLLPPLLLTLFQGPQTREQRGRWKQREPLLLSVPPRVFIIIIIFLQKALLFLKVVSIPRRGSQRGTLDVT